MGKKLPYTPASRIASWIRRGWTRSRESAKCRKDAGYTCSQCGRKQSKAKGKELSVQVHHIEEINWEPVVEVVRREVLDKPQICLCKECHAIETAKQVEERKIAKGKL